MKTGRPSKPNEVHLLEGTARSDRGTDVLVEITGALSERPQLFNMEDGVDRDEVFEMLRGFVNQVTGQAKVDQLLLSQLVDQYELYGNAKKIVMSEGIIGDNGKLSPYIQQMNNSLANCHKLMREFGLTPATRGQVKASNQMADDPLDNLMMGPR